MTPDSGPSPKRVLIVDDELVVAMDMEMQLHSFGYDVVGIASSGKEAISQMETTWPDLVLMDVKLQGAIDGVATATAIQRMRPTPILFVSAFGGDAARRHAEAAPACGYLSKPFRPEDLRKAIEFALAELPAPSNVKNKTT